MHGIEPLADETVVAAMQAWLEKAVIGLNLCPFAKAVHVKRQVRYVVSRAETEEALIEDLLHELQLLASADPGDIETTLLVHPRVLTDFLDYNDFLDIADAAVEELELDGVLQVASFHPQYQFADSHPDDMGNFSNRAPYPTLHLLREDSVDKAVAAFRVGDRFFEPIIARREKLGPVGWAALFGK
ncbi:MAG: DUF1415 domain-containing protein [Arenimonas sp.]|uniref:DUF1415 domain-containing protein n=1 Tax=Arenimonas sp. TaxID=1872635 RepID=UPI0025BCCC3C|nr:DUF1415 domain-containing protein [Arenimonas sp.]MBW8366954.1 DUF1415 domain-containing protein [Arenimonas sp.]